ncbi:MAG: hypothetical protein JWM96_646 [Alphaproteobacteria bacterium]|nr:hypothetical protein [Alphaproteobacteria bacterium]
MTKLASPHETHYDRIAFFSDENAASLFKNNKNDIMFALDKWGTVLPITNWIGDEVKGLSYASMHPGEVIGTGVGFFGKINVGTMKKLGYETPGKLRHFADGIQEVLKEPGYARYKCGNGLNHMKKDRAGPFTALDQPKR